MKVSNRALLLDRDGVINVNHGYVHRAEDCQFIPGIFELCQRAIQQNYLIIIVTNQSGIARRYYSRQQFHQFSRWIEHQFWLRGATITHTYHCPHHPKENGPFGFRCTCRKPKPGMIFKAQRDFNLDLTRSIMVGDSLSDMQCARQAGIKQAVLFKENLLPKYRPKLAKRDKKPYYLANDLAAIAALL